MTASLFDLLGIALGLADRATPAAALLPQNLLSLTAGINLSADALTIVSSLNAGTSFTKIRPGVDPRAKVGDPAKPGQLAFAADMAVNGAPATTFPFYLHSLPDLGIQLHATDPMFPARVYAAVDGRGVEVIIDRLPVTLILKSGLATSLKATTPEVVGDFDKTAVDSFSYTLDVSQVGAKIDCFVRLHLTVEGDVILEPTVPISLGPVRWMGLPAKAVYDIQLLPSPERTEYLEWTHNNPGSFFSNPPVKGAYGFRSIDLDYDQKPLLDLKSRLKNGAVNTEHIELVMEDVVVPVASPMLPIPSHGTFGFRRKILDPGDIAQAFSLANAPIQAVVYQSGSSGGTKLSIEVEKFFFQTGDVNALDPADQPQVQLKAGLIYQSGTNQNTPGPKVGGTVSIDDQWTLALGLVLDPATTPAKFTVADTTIGLVGLRFGLSVARLSKNMPFKDSFEVLADLFVSGTPDAPGSGKVFKVTSLTGKPLSIVMHDIGWKLGHLSLSGLSMPDGMQLIFANVVHLIIEELGWVEEPNGAPYFSFSGGIQIGSSGGNSVPPKTGDSDDKASGFGIRFRRLRFRLNSDSTQPLLKIDGIFLMLKYGPVDIEGFGYISDFTADNWAVKEMGFGVKVALKLVAMNFSLSALFIKGSRRNLSDPSQDFSYFLAALELGFLPAGPIGLYDIRALVANNMAPNLDSAFSDGEGMVLLKWHQSHDKALSMPASRTLADWLAEKDSLAFGVGCGFSLNGCGGALHLSIFAFFEKAAANTGLLVVGELYLLKNPKPIAFVAIEYDFDKDKFGIMVGVDLSIGDFVQSLPAWLGNIARLTGSLYFGNKPWAFAIGQLADQSTWLSLKIEFDKWIRVKFLIGACIQIVDGGPKGFGIVITLSAGSDWGIGGFLLWGSFGLMIGVWKTGSSTGGLEFWIELGFKIDLFFIFSFGAQIGLRIVYMRNHSFLSLHAEVRIDTPWFMPDVTFTIDKVWQEALPFDTATVTQSLSKATAIDPTAQKGIELLLPGLSGALGDKTFLYTFNQLTGLQGITIVDPHLRDDIPIVSVDSTIAIQLSQPVSNDSMIAGSTYSAGTDAGVQQVQDMTLRYGLKSIAVRRAPRFGPTAGQWTTLISSSDTTFTVGGVAPQTLTFAWDIDQRADGKMAPKNLLVNSSAPYSFVTGSAQNDEEAVRNDPDYPCCQRKSERLLIPKPHVLQFTDLALGTRAPRGERFTGENGAWWHWAGMMPPTIVPGDPIYAGAHVASLKPLVTSLLGAGDLPEVAILATLDLSWSRLPGVLYFEAFAGLKLVGSQFVNLREPGTKILTISAAPEVGSAITRLSIRVEMGKDAIQNVPPSTAFASKNQAFESAIHILRATYITLGDTLAFVGAKLRCKNSKGLGPPGSDASGKLAFLPNHDYEIVVTTAVRLGTKDQGPRETDVSEAIYFRTKGLPGLNAAANVGDDIRRHVATTYPMRRLIPLYRQEPCVLAFENSLSSVLPIDRAPAAGAPPEKAQMFPLQLNVDRIASLDGMKRLTVPSADWISAHRVNPYPPLIWVAEPSFAKSKTRLFKSTDLLVQRLETVKLAVPSCGPQPLDHASQVLLHEPIGPQGQPGAWEAQTGYRATVRQKNGGFTERTGFDIYDLGAFIRQADGGASATLWSVNGSGTLLSPPGGNGRHYASVGELNWDHLEARCLVTLLGADAAGLAVGVGNGTPVPQAMIANIEKDGTGHALVLRALVGNADVELGRKAVSASGPVMLHVTAFDDVVRAAVGEIVVEAPRRAIREGRVAMVAKGIAAFAGISVGALDIYSFDFITSRFNSFAEHVQSHDGQLPVLATGAFGGAPAAVAAVVAGHAGEIAAEMTSNADPQARQALFSGIVAQLGVGLSEKPTGMVISRLDDATGTVGLVLQSPEPLSLTRDVTLALTKHIRAWVWDNSPVVILPVLDKIKPQPRQSAFSDLGRIAEIGMVATTSEDISRAIEAALPRLTFGKDRLEVGKNTKDFSADMRVVRVVASGAGPQVEIYDMAAGGTGKLLEALSLEQAAKRPEISGNIALKPGMIGVIHGGGFHFGHWLEQDIVVPFTALSNGDETAIMIFAMGQVWSAGDYKLKATINRDRWANTGAVDAEQNYHDEATLALKW